MCDINIAFLAMATTCPISTPNTISRVQTRRRIRPRAATRDLKIKLSYLELEGSTRRPTKPICDYGAIIGLLDELLGLLVMEEFPLADGARTE